MNDLILWVISIVNVAGSVLNVKKMPSCFFVWSCCNVFWLVYDISTKAYARSILDVVNLTTSLWGLVSWLKDSKANKSEENKQIQTSETA